MEQKRHIYLMPGLAASSKIFEYIDIDKDHFELHYLEWLEPGNEKEPLSDYASRYLEEIGHPNPILIGVSFGGILVQEISRLITVRKVIIISSIKSPEEMPKRLKFLRITRAYKLFPSRHISRINDFSKYDFHPELKKKGELYNKYLSIRNEKYLNWALHHVLHWDHQSGSGDIVHIHGTNDDIFPIRYIENCIPVEGGTHAMIIVKARKISKIIERLLRS